MTELIVLDFETTGLDPAKDEVLQVSMVDQDGSVLMNEYCRPERVTSWPDAEKINGISPEQVAGCPAFRALLPRVVELLAGAGQIVAYNVSFERGFLDAYGVQTDRLHWAEDPMQLFAARMGGPRRSLTAAAGYFGITFSAHDALEDVKATLRLYQELTAAPLLERLMERAVPSEEPELFTFEEEEDWLRLLKALGLCAFTAKTRKALVYHGLFSDGPVPCEVVGFEKPPLSEDSAVLGLRVGERLLRVCDGYLREMQNAGASKDAASAAQPKRRAASSARRETPSGTKRAGAGAPRASGEKPAAKAGAKSGGRYAAFAAKKTDLRTQTPNPDADPENPFFGRAVVFTGDLALSRAEAAAAVAALGGKVKSSVSKNTDYLVVGQQEAGLVGASGHSTKELRAKELNESGKAEIRLLDEAAFLALLGQAGAGGAAEKEK